MDIEFIQLEHRENVMKLMEICGIDMKEAYQLYCDAGYNFQAAVNKNFNPIQSNPEPAEQPYIPQDNFGQVGQDQVQPNAYYDDDPEFQEFKEFKRNGKTFDSKFPTVSKQGFFKSLLPKFLKGDDDPFKEKLQDYLGRHLNLKNTSGNFSECLNWCWKQKFPMAAIFLDFTQHTINPMKKFFGDDLLIEKVLSQQFKVYGIDCKKYELQAELKPYFNLERDANHLVICRVNHLDQIKMVTKINLTTQDDFRKKIKHAKSQCIQKQLDQSHIIRQYNQELRGNFNYQRPRTIKESIKAREDKKLRKQQEEQFFKACQPKKQEKKEEIKPPPYQPEKKYQHKQQIKPVVPQYQPKSVAPPVQHVQPVQPVQPVQTVSKDKVEQKRRQRLSQLKKYNDGVMFKIRLPEGKSIMVTVGKQERVQYLFDFIENQPDDLGFNNEIERKFNICIGFGGSQMLRGNENKKIKELFEDSEVLIVREQ